MSSLLTLKNPVFAGYAFYGSAVILKQFSLTLLTIKYRQTKKIFSNPEDVSTFGGDKPVFDDSDVERVRRNHLNDVENIPAFLSLGLLYVFIDPDTEVALWHFRIFAISRLLHTIAYQVPLPQPSRALFFGAGLVVCTSMAVQILAKLWK
jgi:uncharacterized membrane protein YecN with MAPEG domain